MGERDGVTQRIVLTGASGFIGTHLQHELLARGHTLTALVRPGSRRRQRILSEVEICSAAFDDRTAIEQALRDCDLVIYCAGSVRGRCRDDFDPANVDGVSALGNAAVRTMAHPRLLLMSSLAATRPHLSDYAASKRAGETVVESIAGLDSVILRPPAVYGPGDREMRPLLRAIRHGLALVPGPREQRLSLLFVTDLARAVGAVVDHYPACKGHVFELDDGSEQGYSWPELIAAARTTMPVLRVPVPRPLLAGLARLNCLLAAVFGYAPMLSPGKVRELSEPGWLCDNRAFSAATGWVPQVSLSAGVRATFSPLPGGEERR